MTLIADMTLNELRDERDGVVGTIRQIAASDDPTSDENQTRFTDQNAKLAELGARINMLEAIERTSVAPANVSLDEALRSGETDGQLAPPTKAADEVANIRVRTGMYGESVDYNLRELPIVDSKTNKAVGSAADITSSYYRKAFCNWLEIDDATGKDFEREYNRVVSDDVNAALNPNIFTEGGWLRTPMTFAAEILRCTENQVFIRQLARTITVNNADALGIRQQTSRPASYAFGCKCQAPTCDAPAGDVKMLQPHLWTVCTQVCREILRSSTVPNVEGFLAAEIANDIAEGEERNFLYGDGQAKPLGLLVDTAVTEKDINQPLVIADIIDFLCTMPQTHLSNGPVWIISTEMKCALAKLADGNSRPLWLNADASVAGSPFQGSLLGYPVYTSQHITNGDPGNVGDHPISLIEMGKFWIADRFGTELERYVQPDVDQVSFYRRGYIDAMLVCPDAALRGIVVA